MNRNKLERLERLASRLPTLPETAAPADELAIVQLAIELCPFADNALICELLEKHCDPTWTGPDWKAPIDRDAVSLEIPPEVHRRWNAAVHLIDRLGLAGAGRLLEAQKAAAWDWKCYRGRYADRLHPLPAPDPVTGYDPGPFHPPAVVHPDAWPGGLPLANLPIDGDLRRRTAEALAEFVREETVGAETALSTGVAND
jgi:hypothetical protein